MLLIRLAFANVWRRLSYSALSLLAMAMAAAVLTSGLSLAQGTARMAYKNYRAYFGGEIMVYAPGFVGATALETTSEAAIVQRVLHDSGFNHLLRLYPDFATRGYLAEEEWVYSTIGSERMDSLLSQPGIVAAEPQFSMPVFVGNFKASLRPLPAGWEELVVLHARPDSIPDDAFAVVLNAFSGYGGAPQVGAKLLISIPQYQVDSLGVPNVDYSQPFTVHQATAAATIARPTRTITWAPEGGGVEYEQGYVHAPEIYLPADLWQELWYQHSGGIPYPITAVSLRVNDMSQLNVLTSHIQANNPDLSVFSIATLARHVERYALLDRFYMAPPVLWQPLKTEMQVYAPREFGLTSAILLYLNAGILLASQMLTAVSSRRNEIGILKAVGGRNREVVGMILIEATLLAVIGASIGFGLVRLLGIYQSLTNRLDLMHITTTTMREMGVVVSMTVLISVVFGILPAWRVARLTVMDVFRNE